MFANSSLVSPSVMCFCRFFFGSRIFQAIFDSCCSTTPAGSSSWGSREWFSAPEAFAGTTFGCGIEVRELADWNWNELEETELEDCWKELKDCSELVDW